MKIIVAKWKGAGPEFVYLARDTSRTRKQVYWSTLRENAELFPDDAALRIRTTSILDQVTEIHFEPQES